MFRDKLSAAAMAIVLLAPAMARADDNAVPVKVTGTVTFDATGDDYFFIRRDGDGRSYRVACYPRTAKPSGLSPGMHVAIEGWERRNSTTPRYVYCRAAATGADAEPPSPRAMTIPEMHFNPSFDNSLVRNYGEFIVTQGRVADISRRKYNTLLTLTDGGMSLQVTVSSPDSESLPPGLDVGAEVRVAGPYLFYVEGDDSGNPIASIHSVSTILHNFREIEIVRRAPWLTVGRLVAMLFVALVLAAVVFGIVRIRQRIAADAREEERLRIAGNLHDNFMQMLIGAKSHIRAARLRLISDGSSADNSLRDAEAVLKDAEKHLKMALWRIIGE